MSKKEDLDIACMLIPTMTRTIKYVDLLMEKRLAESSVGLTLKQYILLYHTRNGGRNQSDLALITDRDKGSLTRLIQGLERKDLVSRTEDENDKRINIVEPTIKGRAAMEKASIIVRSAFDELGSDISEKNESLMKSTSIQLMERAMELLAKTSQETE